MDVRFWATTHTGRVRDHNEDNFVVDSDLNLFVVCDGMGGHAGGEVASAISVETMHEVIGGRRDVIDAYDADPANAGHREAVVDLMKQAVAEASARVHRAAERDGRRTGMGTTCSALLIRGGRGFVSHVGDSRIYRRRGEQIDQITDDHSLLNEMIRQGRARRGDSIQNPNAVTRAVGVQESVDVDAAHFEVAAGDLFVLCSDGLSGYLDDAELRQLLDGDDLEASARACINHALQSGGKDNITAILANVVSTDSAPRARLDGRGADILATRPPFDQASPSELVELASIAERHRFDAGATIVEADKSADALCVIVDGSVGVTGPSSRVVVLEDDGFFGAAGLFAEPTYEETYEAIEPTNLLVFRRVALFELLRHRPELSAKVLFGLATRMAGQLRRVPTGLRLAPDRWDEVRIQGSDATPGFTAVTDADVDSPAGQPTSPSNPTVDRADPPADDSTDRLRSTMQLDLSDHDL